MSRSLMQPWVVIITSVALYFVFGSAIIYILPDKELKILVINYVFSLGSVLIIVAAAFQVLLFYFYLKGKPKQS